MLRNKDFTPYIHKQLLESLLKQGYEFHTFSAYLSLKNRGAEDFVGAQKFIILRHDVEKYYENALVMAKIQNELGIRGSYYFRILPHHFKPKVIKEIADLGHEIGYHYDDLAQCGGVHEKAILRFQKNLQAIRDIAPVKTICMDGSPLSKFDNKDLWRAGEKVFAEHVSYHYSDFGIIGEPYYDMDFDNVFYLTDTGRRWDGWKTSVRDKVPQQAEWVKQGLVFHSTQDIIKAAEEGRLPEKIMMTFHPQRWNDKAIPWLKELVIQNIKNQIKKLLIKQNS